MNNIIKSKYNKTILTVIIMLALSAIIMAVTFIFSSANLNMEMYLSYYKSIKLLIINIFPIFIFLSLVYLITNRLWIGFLLSSMLFVIASLVNKFKLTFRDDPFIFMDIKLINESVAMTKQYEIKFTLGIIVILAALAVITILIKKFYKHKIRSGKLRISLVVIIMIVTALSFKGVYYNDDIYAELGDDSLINVWSEPQQFQSKGFVYPFLHSMKDAKEYPPEGYNEEKAINDLNQYQYKDIPEDEKVNFIGVMLEAYNDFSKFDTIDIEEEVYRDFHEVQKSSLHGKLVTNVFAGGTIDTERAFVTGYHDHPRYLENTNSFAWYFKEQGYRTKAMHPIYGWFYNRRNVNPYLGFDSFDYYENKYQAENPEFLNDDDFFDYIIEDYEKSRDEGQPYFHYSTTYQNHGPYSDEKLVEKEYLKRKPQYNDTDYNIINNYLNGIKETGEAVKNMTEYFEGEEEPVVIVMFGDHNPALGEDSTGYAMMDIDMDFSTKQGFKNYYETPYIVWGNTAAKEKFDRDFNEEAEDLSPNFLMPEVFEYLGWEGDEYMQYLMQIKKTIDVNHEVFFKENGKYTKELTKENQEIYDDFKNLQYYYGRNFKTKIKDQ